MIFDRPVPMDCSGQILRHSPEEIACALGVDVDAWIFRGHYPHYAIFPGVYLIETALQTVERHLRMDGFVAARISELKSARLMLPVVPGDELECIAKLLHRESQSTFSSWEVNCLLKGKPAARVKVVVEGLR